MDAKFSLYLRLLCPVRSKDWSLGPVRLSPLLPLPGVPTFSFQPVLYAWEGPISKSLTSLHEPQILNFLRMQHLYVMQTLNIPSAVSKFVPVYYVHVCVCVCVCVLHGSVQCKQKRCSTLCSIIFSGCCAILKCICALSCLSRPISIFQQNCYICKRQSNPITGLARPWGF